MLVIGGVGVRLCFARGARATAFGIYVCLCAATNGRRDLGVARAGAIPVARPIGGVPALAGVTRESVRKMRRGRLDDPPVG